MTTGSTGSRLLIVDDDRDFGDSLAEALELHGHEVDTTTTGEDGIAAAGKTHYDAILMDISLPGKNGVESLIEIQETDPKTRCFLMTGYSADHLALRAIKAGAIEVLTKPLDPNELARRLDAIRNPDA
jgi:DNA-binding response OmpR family regulator